MTRRFAVLAALALAPAVGVMLLGLGQPLHGEHVFRQSHVAANVEKFVAHGLSLRPETYNQDVPAALFEFPLYTWLVAGLCRLTGSPVVATARAVNVLVFVLTLVALDVLWRRSGAVRTQRFFGLVIFAYAPLALFYYQVPLPDPLALLLALGSLVAYLAWERAAPGRRRGPALAWMACAALAALVKNPLYLPYAIAIVWHRFRRRGWRGLADPAVLAFLALLALVVVGWKLYSNHVNGATAFLDPAESDAYFGPLGDRLRPRFWRLLGTAFSTQTALPLTLVLGALGFALYALRARRRDRALHVGLGLGCAVTLFVFFNRYREHPYYQLPFEPLLAFFAAWVPARAHAWLRSARPAKPVRAWLPRASGAVLCVALTWQGLAGLREMSAAWDAGLAERGAFIAGNSAADDFVVFVVGWRADNWEPSHLYFARRDGYNLVRAQLTYARLADLQRRFAPRYARFLIFTPAAWVEDVDERLRPLGARAVASDENLGRLYQLEPAWLHPAN